MKNNGGGGVGVSVGEGGGMGDGVGVGGGVDVGVGTGDGDVITPLNPTQDQYGPAFWADNLMMRKDDKPAQYAKYHNVVAPGFGRGV